MIGRKYSAVIGFDKAEDAKKASSNGNSKGRKETLNVGVLDLFGSMGGSVLSYGAAG